MSHDFRTPMNAISGFASIALDNLNDTKRVGDCLEKILTSSEHLLNLVNDILDMSRVESGKISVVEEPINLHAMSDMVDRMFSEEAAQKNIAVAVDTHEIENPYVMTDPLRMSQIVTNIVGNSLKYTPEGGEVYIHASQDKKAYRGYRTYEFTATDTGCGMSPEFLEHLFEPFARDTGEYAIKAEGTGLGMTITKNIIDLLGGSIKVESEVGVGTTFTVSLPLRQTDVEPARKTSSLALPMTGGKPYEGLRALVVDDDDLSREVLATIVSGLGFEIEEASNGREALAKIEESEANYYAVVLTDMRMPIMDGISFTKAVRALPREDTATLPLIAETADAFEEERRRARAAGMTDFITKPIKINELHEVLESVVDRI
jgi:CheY-like chemotaxis protein/two-component sensor histidine kinase